jgi:hypothetical protein
MRCSLERFTATQTDGLSSPEMLQTVKSFHLLTRIVSIEPLVSLKVKENVEISSYEAVIFQRSAITLSDPRNYNDFRLKTDR